MNEEKKERPKKIIKCLNKGCQTKLRVPETEEKIKLRCPSCQFTFEYEGKYHYLYTLEGKSFLAFLTNTYTLQSRFDEAIEISQKKTEISPDDEYAFYGLGLSHYGKLYQHYQELNKTYSKAVEALKKAIEINPKNPSPHLTLSIIYTSNNHPQEAIETLQRFLKVKGRDKLEDTEVYKILASSYQLLGNNKEAKKFYQKALTQEPSSLQVHYSLGKLYLEEKKYQKAIEEFEKEIEVTLSNPKILKFELKHIPSFLGSILNLKEALKKRGLKEEQIKKNEILKKAYEAVNLSDSEIEKELKSLESIFPFR